MKDKTKRILKLIKRYRFFMIFMVLMFSVNTYAWFMYVTRVDTSLTARVRSWNVMFQVHDNNIAQEVVFDAADIYPGMPDYEDLASVVNTGDTIGDIYFNIKRVQILNEVYTSADYTTEQLLSRLENNYPFTISLSLSNNKVYPGTTETFNIEITWPYESNNDALDTQWGVSAYQYRNSNPGQPCVVITAEVRVDQSQNQSQTPTPTPTPPATP